MVDPSIHDEITKQLDRMPVAEQRRVLDFAHAVGNSGRGGESGTELLRFAGLFDADSIREMKKAIESGCERVDPDEW